MSAWENRGITDEWMTPRYVFEALGLTFDLDPAHPPARTNVPALRTLSFGGLEAPWRGTVWLNPPYGGRGGLEPWLARFFDHGDGIALVPDRTSAPWFQAAWKRADLVLFVNRKIKFERLDGTRGEHPGSGSALFAAGPAAIAGLNNAELAGLGYLAMPWRARRRTVTVERMP